MLMQGVEITLDSNLACKFRRRQLKTILSRVLLRFTENRASPPTFTLSVINRGLCFIVCSLGTPCKNLRLPQNTRQRWPPVMAAKDLQTPETEVCADSSFRTKLIFFSELRSK